MSRLFFPPPPFPITGTTTTSPSSASSTSTSIIIVIIVIASAVLISASLYLLIRFVSRRFRRSPRISAESNAVSTTNRDFCVKSPREADLLDSLPLFTFGSVVTKKAEAGDCAVCLSKFEPSDQLRLLPLCCHAFHADCIDTWLASNQTCPLCRSSVNPTEDDVQSKILAPPEAGEDRSNSFRIEIGNISRRQSPPDSGEDRRSYSIGSFEYIVNDGYEVSVESTLHRGVSDCTSVDKDSTGVPPPGESLAADVSGSQSWLREYVDRFSSSILLSSQSFRSSGRFFTGSSRRSDVAVPEDVEANNVGEEISELFRWLSGV
ncbi:hypothetical protein LguiB_011083 [Lonicera macranthoides]